MFNHLLNGRHSEGVVQEHENRTLGKAISAGIASNDLGCDLKLSQVADSRVGQFRRHFHADQLAKSGLMRKNKRPPLAAAKINERDARHKRHGAREDRRVHGFIVRGIRIYSKPFSPNRKTRLDSKSAVKLIGLSKPLLADAMQQNTHDRPQRLVALPFNHRVVSGRLCAIKSTSGTVLIMATLWLPLAILNEAYGSLWRNYGKPDRNFSFDKCSRADRG